MKTIVKLFYALVFVGAVPGIFAAAAHGQDTPDREEGTSKRMTIEILEDGTVILNGRRLPEGDRFMLREGAPGDRQSFSFDIDPDAIRRDVEVFRREQLPALRDRMQPFFESLPGGPIIERREFRSGDGEGESDVLMFNFGNGIPRPDLMTPEVLKLEREARELARKARDAEGAERQRLERELETALERAFEARQEAREKALKEMESRVESEAKALQEREHNKEDIIERRLQELLGRPDNMNW